MERKVGIALAAALVATLVAMVSLAVVATPPVPPPSATVTIDQLRAGVEIDLGRVHVHETSFRDLTQIDAGITVSFVLSFADGLSENISFVFRTQLCQDVRVTSNHRKPGVLFEWTCGDSSIFLAIV